MESPGMCARTEFGRTSKINHRGGGHRGKERTLEGQGEDDAGAAVRSWPAGQLLTCKKELRGTRYPVKTLRPRRVPNWKTGSFRTSGSQKSNVEKEEGLQKPSLSDYHVAEGVKS